MPKKGKREEEREREKLDGGREGGRVSLSFSPLSPFPFSLFPTSHVSTLVTQTKQCLSLLRWFKETPVRSSFTFKPEKSVVIIIYSKSQNIILKPLHRAVGSPMSPHYGDLVSISVEGCDFLGEVFSFELFYTKA